MDIRDELLLQLLKGYQEGHLYIDSPSNAMDGRLKNVFQLIAIMDSVKRHGEVWESHEIREGSFSRIDR